MSPTKKNETKDTAKASDVEKDKPGEGKVGHGTGLESLAVDREVERKAERKGNGPKKVTDPAVGVTVNEDGERIPAPQLQDNELITYADSGEPVVAGGVPDNTSGVPAEAAGTQDPSIGASVPTAAMLRHHEETRDDWFEIDPEDSDGSPSDRVRSGQPQSPQMESETQEAATDTKEAKDAR